MNSIATHSTRFVCIQGTRVLAVLACMGLAQQAAFAQKAKFERTIPHVNVGTIGHIDLEPIPDPILTGDSEDPESPCPCQNGGDFVDDAEAPLELLILLSPRLDVESLRDGEDVALVYADVRGLAPDVYVVRLYEFDDGFVTTLVNWDGDEVPFESDVLIAEGDDAKDPWGGFGCSKSGGYCCLTVCNDSGCAWICISRDLTIYAGSDGYD